MGGENDLKDEITRSDPKLSIFDRIVHLLRNGAHNVSYTDKSDEQSGEHRRQLDATLEPVTSEKPLFLIVSLEMAGSNRIFDIRLNEEQPWNYNRAYRLEVQIPMDGGGVRLDDNFGETTIPSDEVLTLISDARVGIPYWAKHRNAEGFSRLSKHLGELISIDTKSATR